MKGFVAPPNHVTVGGVRYRIQTDFRKVLEVDKALTKGADETAAAAEALRLFYGTIPYPVPEAVAQLCWFLRRGKEKTSPKKKDKPEALPELPVYDISHDAGLIYAAFLTQYGIDLLAVDQLHWWQFTALLEGLEDGRRFKEVVHCRAVKITPDMPKAQRDYYADMKKKYALPLPEGLEEHLQQLEAMLLGDGDIASLQGRAENEERG